MEILKGFSFDLQRFTDVNAAGTEGVITVNATANDTLVYTINGTDWMSATNVAAVTEAGGIFYATVEAFEETNDEATVSASSLSGLNVVGDIGTLTLASYGETQEVTVSQDAEVELYDAAGGTFTGTGVSVSNKVMGATNLVVKSGALKLGVAIDADLSTSDNLNTSVEYAANLNLSAGVTVTTLPTDAETGIDVVVKEAEDANKTATVITMGGNISGLDAGGTVEAEYGSKITVTNTETGDDAPTATVVFNKNGVASVTTEGTATIASDGGAILYGAQDISSDDAAQLTVTTGQTGADITVNKGTFVSVPLPSGGTWDINTSVAGGGDVTVRKVTFEGDGTGENIDAVGTYTSNTSFTLTKGIATVDESVTGEITVNENYKFTNGDEDAALQVAVVDETTGIYGESKVVAKSGTIEAIYNKAGVLTVGDSVEVKTKDNIVVEGDEEGNTKVSGLTAVGDTVTITNKNGTTKDETGEYSTTIITVTAVDGESVRASVSFDGGKTYNAYTATVDTVWSEAGGNGAEPVPTGPIVTAEHMENGPVYFNADGQVTDEDEGDDVAKLTTGSNRKLEVYGVATYGIDISDDTIEVKETGKANTYTLKEETKIQGKTFKVDSEGALTSASGTITVVDGTLAVANSNAAGNKVTIDLTAEDTDADGVSYAAGVNLNNTTVITNGGKYVITETQNKDTATATEITAAGNITGLDASATVTGFAKKTGAAITTAGNGKFTINGTAWTVSESENGVTLGYNEDGVLDELTLEKGEVVDTTAKLTGKDIAVKTVGGGAAIGVFTFTKAQSGASFSYDGTDATAAVFAKGDVVVVDGGEDPDITYTVNSIGSGKEGVIITSDGGLAGLTDGDKVTVESDEGEAVYEVSGKAMIVNGKDAYTLTDEAEPFAVNDAVEATDIVNATAGTTINATMGQSGTAAAVTSIVDGVYVNADGTLTFSKDKAVGKITETDDLVKYDSVSTKAQQVSVSDEDDGAGSKDWYITTGSGKDQITFADNTNVSINGGAGDDVISATGTGDKVLYVSNGKNEIELGAGNAKVSLGSGNDTLNATAAGSGDIVVTAAGGNNFINFGKSDNDYVTITGSSGDDTIVAGSAENVVKGNGGNNVYMIEGDFDGDDNTEATKVTISDYTFGKDVIMVDGTGAPTVDKANLTADGTVSLTSGAEADISATAGSFYAATLVDEKGKNAVNIAWAKDGAARLDTSSFSKDAQLFGNEDGANYLVSGAGKDVIHSYGDNDTVYGGAGNDSYVFDSSSNTGRVVGFSTNGGKDSVVNFNAKFEEGDSIYMLDGSFANLKGSYDASTNSATLKSGSAQLTFSGINPQDSGAAEFVINNRRAAVLAAGATASVESASYADAYIGDNSAVDFSAVSEDLYVDLSNDLSSSGSGAKFVGIHTVVGGSGKSTLMGSAKDDLITAGTGGSSLYGGKGKDTLVGNGDYADMFFIGGGSGMSTISSFQTSEYDNADTVKVLGNVTATKLTDAGIEISSDSSKGIITDVVDGNVDANAKVRIESNNFTGVAKVGYASSSNSFTFEQGVGYYGGGSSEDKLAVDSNNTENAQVWLDGSAGVAYTSVDVVDFSNGTADYILAGDSAKNTIIGGSGNNSLWGGAGNSVDTLQGNANGTTMFWWGYGEGNDVVDSQGANDSVNLYNIKLSDVDLTNTAITDAGVTLALNDGSKLTVNTSRDITFAVDGTSWTAQHSSKEWKQNS